jgi:DNA invertase Pin-like site-specific DNA recombinase
MKTAAIYVRVSTADQHVESQLYDLRELAAQRGLQVVQEYRDSGVSGKRARRPGLDALIADARRKKFSVVLVAAFDRVARSVKHFLQVMDEFDSLGVVFISRRENIDTSGAMGRLLLTLIGMIAELESDLIRERVLAGMRRAKLDGVRIGRAPMKLDRTAIVRDRLSGMTLTAVSKKWGVSAFRCSGRGHGREEPQPISFWLVRGCSAGQGLGARAGGRERARHESGGVVELAGRKEIRLSGDVPTTAFA